MKYSIKPHQDKIHPIVAILILVAIMAVVSIVDSGNHTFLK